MPTHENPPSPGTDAAPASAGTAQPPAFRKLLLAAFTAGSFETFCFDHYPAVRGQFTPGMAQDQRISLLLDTVQQHASYPALAERVRRERPEKYAEHAAGLFVEAAAPPSPTPAVAVVSRLETGTMAADSAFYVPRSSDGEALAATDDAAYTLVVKAPRQFGKSSLSARLVQRARARGWRTFFLDFQEFDQAARASLPELFRSLVCHMADALGVAGDPLADWNARLSPAINMANFLSRRVLCAGEPPVLLAFDEVDVFFGQPYQDDFFAALRAWHNRRGTEPEPWGRLSLIFTHSTEPYLWIANVNQSPFNVGAPIWIPPFESAGVTALHERHGSPLGAGADVAPLVDLLGGHPHLTRLALHALATDKATLAALLAPPGGDDGDVFGEHLRALHNRFLAAPGVLDCLRRALREGACTDERTFLRLKAAGLLVGDWRNCRAANRLYGRYFGGK